MAGSIIVTTSDLGGGETKYSVAWLCSATGVVSANTFDIKRGSLLRLVFVPNAAGTQPSDLYDVTLLDSNSIDILAGSGGDLSNASAISFEPETTIEPGTFTLAVANAGNAKGGTVVLIVGPAGAGALQSESLPVGASTAAKQDSALTQETAIAAALGVTTGAAVVTDANGTVQQYLRGLVKLLIATLTTQIAGWLFANMTTATTTTIKSGAGVLHIINVNTLGTVASTVIAYDSLTASGTKIATINSLTLSGPFQYDIAFSTGLTIITTGTAAPDITVSYR